jgi:hypothetical protein
MFKLYGKSMTSAILGLTGVVGFVLLIIVWILLWPLAVIWAVNTLFSLGIAYTFWTWLAVVVLTATFGKASVNTNKN